MKQKKVKTMLLAGSLAALLTIGGSVAYLTDVERTTNKFQVGKVDIELSEPNWNEDDNQQIEPTQVIKKDPMVTNIGVNDAYVYLEVEVPMAEVITAAENGIREANGAKVYQELFTFESNNNWTLISKNELNNYMVYTYSYDKILSAGDATNTLFDTVTFANVVEGQIDENKYEIPVHAFAIQTENTGNGSGNVKAEAKAAYTKYVNQNLKQPGAVEVQGNRPAPAGSK